MAIARAPERIIQTLLDLGANPNYFHIDYCSGGISKPPLFVAIDYCRPSVIHMLIAGGADPNVEFMGETPLKYILKKARPASLTEDAFAYARDRIFIKLLENGATLEGFGVDYPTIALSKAVWTGSTKIVSAVLDRIPDCTINKPDRSGKLPLSAAISYGYSPIVYLLMDRGANLSQPQYGVPPLVALTKCGLPDKIVLINEFIDRGTDVNACNFSDSLLEWAIINYEINVLQKLVSAGIKLTSSDKWFHSSILFYVIDFVPSRYKPEWKLAIIQILVRAGADLFQEDRNGKTVIEQIVSIVQNLDHPDRDRMLTEIVAYVSAIKQMKRNLRFMCRKVIRRKLNENCTKKHINSLPLPSSLKSYLVYQECPVTQWNIAL